FSTASFYHWRRKIGSQASAQGEFLAVEVSDPRTSNRKVRVRFPCGTQLELDADDYENVRLVVDRLATRAAEEVR
ncbi:IS66 family insertion sequence element accessory protein TnpA, partial [Rhodopirellula sp. JC639]|uniref:IS66 family insertion sequence element accessory protein TnpA n=1 Tax=Stieleria mannarensis TaxID=2755585 RepID=UPI0016037DE6